MIKEALQQEDRTLVNIYIPTVGAPTYAEQILVDSKGESDRNTVIVEDFNTSLTLMDRSSGQKMNKEMAAWNDTLDKMDLTSIFRAFLPKAAEYTFFSSAQGMLPRVDHRLEHKTNLNKCKIDISSIFSVHDGMN